MAVIRGLPLLCSMQLLACKGTGRCLGGKGGNLSILFFKSLAYWSTFLWEKKGKLGKTPVDSSYENDSDQSNLVPVVITWLVHKLLLLLRGLFQYRSCGWNCEEWVRVALMGVMGPELVMMSIVSVVIAGVLASEDKVAAMVYLYSHKLGSEAFRWKTYNVDGKEMQGHLALDYAGA
ncbi:hypothetical protein VNO77_01967 [Canavalia gladiata]|uniref:Uncharacterized protein n=1 Tax=Canavalia gladiata TaxID=3824 RepID=A0AAN9MS48_CANGL